jgi:hypothetical protein
MRIELNPEQQRRLFEWAAKVTKAHVDAGCEPPGYELVISFGPLENLAQAHSGTASLDLGEVLVRDAVEPR